MLRSLVGSEMCIRDRYNSANGGGGGLSTPPMVIVRGLSSNAGGGHRHNRTLSEQDMYTTFDSPLLGGDRNGLLPLTGQSTPNHNEISGAENPAIPDTLGSSSRSFSNMNMPVAFVSSPRPQHNSSTSNQHQQQVEFDDDAPPGVSFMPPPLPPHPSAPPSHHHLFQHIDDDDNDAPPFAMKLSSPPPAVGKIATAKITGPPLLSSKPIWGPGDVGVPDIGLYYPGPYDGLQNTTTAQQINVSREALLTGVDFPAMFRQHQQTALSNSNSMRTSSQLPTAQPSTTSIPTANNLLEQPKGAGGYATTATVPGGGNSIRGDLPTNMSAFGRGGGGTTTSLLNDSDNNLSLIHI
eukprot:TRINITY_DN5596_c0_g1_i5.p1 TRINITY_DN5596_c0_g1~~TRINITY_DN5596_c0_g1_i5.p1  ORF type:complete len:351 (-),score=58.30 TRINITY_DN5596_c0_g1_i5:164-1216(-)